MYNTSIVYDYISIYILFVIVHYQMQYPIGNSNDWDKYLREPSQVSITKAQECIPGTTFSGEEAEVIRRLVHNKPTLQKTVQDMSHAGKPVCDIIKELKAKSFENQVYRACMGISNLVGPTQQVKVTTSRLKTRETVVQATFVLTDSGEDLPSAKRTKFEQ